MATWKFDVVCDYLHIDFDPSKKPYLNLRSIVFYLNNIASTRNNFLRWLARFNLFTLTFLFTHRRRWLLERYLTWSRSLLCLDSCWNRHRDASIKPFSIEWLQIDMFVPPISPRRPPCRAVAFLGPTVRQDAPRADVGRDVPQCVHACGAGGGGVGHDYSYHSYH